MPQSAPAPSDASVLFCVILIFLVPFAAAGIALINTGLGRSRSAAHTMMCSLCVFSVAALAYFACGFAWQGFAGGPSHALSVNGKEWSWIAAQPFLLRQLGVGGWPAFSAALLGLLSVGVAEWTAGDWEQPAYQPLSSPPAHIRCLLIGYGEGDGSRSWV
jgi:ammonia channel protein AmtB